MKQGSLMLVLHAHLPFVRHPEHKEFLEERWLFEAMTETYIPLIQIYERLHHESIPFKITMSITPPLANMLQDDLLKTRYATHLDKLIELSEREIERTYGDERFASLATFYHQKFLGIRETYRSYEGDLIRAFKKFQNLGSLEIITCGATHGFLPLMQGVRKSVEAQVTVACDHYEKTFSKRARGIWLPECGYYEGYDEILKQNGLDYFFLDTHGILHAEPQPKYGVFAPLHTPRGCYAFGRDFESSKQVWSASEGYPGDVNYREFYRDIGFDLEDDYIKPYVQSNGDRIGTGIKYYKVTGETEQKEVYHPVNAQEKADEHARDFLFKREKQIEHLSGVMEKQPVIVAPYDAELFGHWWYEGPQFLEFLMRKISCDSKVLQLTHAPDYLNQNTEHQPSTPSFSSWGYNGYAEFWLDGSNDWIYPHLHQASQKMSSLARDYQTPGELERRALNQAARELLLAESSDWAFIMKTGTTIPYAIKRTKDHLSRFFVIEKHLRSQKLDEEWLREIESRDNIFLDINYRIYA